MSRPRWKSSCDPEAGARHAVDLEVRAQQGLQLRDAEVAVLVSAGLRGGLERRPVRPAAPQRLVDVERIEPVQQPAMRHADDEDTARRGPPAVPRRSPLRGGPRARRCRASSPRRPRPRAMAAGSRRPRAPLSTGSDHSRRGGDPGRARRRPRLGPRGHRPGSRRSHSRMSNRCRPRAARPPAASGARDPSARRTTGSAAASGEGPAGWQREWVSGRGGLCGRELDHGHAVPPTASTGRRAGARPSSRRAASGGPGAAASSAASRSAPAR